MPPAYPSHLYVRCDRELRAALVIAAAANGESVSVLARRRLRTSLGLADEPPPPKRGPAATVAEEMHRAGAPARKLARDLVTLSDRKHGRSR